MKIEKLGDYARVTCADGEYGLPQWAKVLESTVSLGCHVLLDLRGVKSRLSEIETYLLALQADELAGFRLNRLALVADTNAEECSASYFANSGRNLGMNVASFADQAEAVSWIQA